MCLCSAASDHAFALIPPGKHAIKMLVSKKQNRERERERERERDAIKMSAEPSREGRNQSSVDDHTPAKPIKTANNN
jgi:hypothetical protein